MKKILFLSVGLLWCGLQTALGQTRPAGVQLDQPYQYGDGVEGCFKNGTSTCWNQIDMKWFPPRCGDQTYSRNLITDKMAEQFLVDAGLTHRQLRDPVQYVYCSEDHSSTKQTKTVLTRQKNGEIVEVVPSRTDIHNVGLLGALIADVYGCTSGLHDKQVQTCNARSTGVARTTTTTTSGCIPDGSEYKDPSTVFESLGEIYDPREYQVYRNSCGDEVRRVEIQRSTNTVYAKGSIKGSYPDKEIICLESPDDVFEYLGTYRGGKPELQLIDKKNGVYEFRGQDTLFVKAYPVDVPIVGTSYADMYGSIHTSSATVVDTTGDCPVTYHYTLEPPKPDTIPKSCIVQNLGLLNNSLFVSGGVKRVMMSGDGYPFLNNSWNTLFGELTYREPTDRQTFNIFGVCYREGFEGSLGVQMDPSLDFDAHAGFINTLALRKIQVYARAGYRVETYWDHLSIGIVPELYAHTHLRRGGIDREKFDVTLPLLRADEPGNPISTYTHSNILVYAGARFEIGYQKHWSIKLFAARYRSLQDKVSRSELGVRLEYPLPLLTRA